jgi:hypothetical protein
MDKKDINRHVQTTILALLIVFLFEKANYVSKDAIKDNYSSN